MAELIKIDGTISIDLPTPLTSQDGNWIVTFSYGKKYQLVVNCVESNRPFSKTDAEQVIQYGIFK